MKKTNLLKGLALLVVAGSLASCGNSSLGGTDISQGNVDEVKESILAKQASTGLEAMKLMQNISGTQNLKLRNSKNNISQNDIDTIQQLLSQFDMILENNNLFESSASESDIAEYSVKEIITLKDINGKQESYTLYYNETNSFTDVEHDDDELETETTTLYEGIALYSIDGSEVKYNFNSITTVSEEDDEIEIESTFRLREENNPSNYIIIEKENETEGSEVEDSYEYTIYNNNRKVYEYEISVEFDDRRNKKQIELELNNIEYEIDKIERNGETLFYVEVENDNTDEEADLIFKKVIDENGNVTYQLI